MPSTSIALVPTRTMIESIAPVSSYSGRGAFGNGPNTRDPYYAEVVRLRDQVEDLQEQLRALKELVSPPGMLFPSEWRLTGKETALLRALMAAITTITKERLLVALYDTEPEVEIKIVDVFVCKLRNKLRPHKITVETMWGSGYRLTPAMKAKITAAVETERTAGGLIRFDAKNGGTIYNGDELRAQRHDLNMSQAAVAKLARAPHAGYVCSIENGSGSPVWHRLIEEALRAERRRQCIPDPAPSGA